MAAYHPRLPSLASLGLQRNCNYASIFPWLDRIFGSHYLPKYWPPQYGIPEPMADTLVGQLVQPLREPQALPTARAQGGS
jgi:sterol desaturase/sphingolipid hydroxylase (fatty acid hydroxylase superfamily)